VGAACGQNCPGGLLINCVGQCRAGVIACVSGARVCQGSSGPTLETCNNKDDDCDGTIDDNLTDPWAGQSCCPTGNLADCTNTGANGRTGTRCAQGAWQCVTGARVCSGGVSKSLETCNGVDDDCNGTADDVPGIGDACNSGGVNVQGVCTATYTCTGMPGQGPGGLTCTH